MSKKAIVIVLLLLVAIVFVMFIMAKVTHPVAYVKDLVMGWFGK